MMFGAKDKRKSRLFWPKMTVPRQAKLSKIAAKSRREFNKSRFIRGRKLKNRGEFAVTDNVFAVLSKSSYVLWLFYLIGSCPMMWSIHMIWYRLMWVHNNKIWHNFWHDLKFCHVCHTYCMTYLVIKAFHVVANCDVMIMLALHLFCDSLIGYTYSQFSLRWIIYLIKTFSS